jgi:arabinofuranosyltransferase
MTDPSPDTELATPLEAPRPRGGIAGLPWARISWIVASLLLLGYGVVLLRTAWISDDAFITFRVVDNLFRGHGLRWNPDERVWVNVHVLWIGFVSLLRALAGELYYSTIFASIGLSLLSVSLIVWRLAPSVLSAVPALALLLSSKAFVDFSTGGLENPLSTLILVAALISWFRLREGRRLWALAICMALGILTRPDSILLLGPLLLAAAWGRPWKTLLRVGLVAFGPMLLWLMIATVYFGTPVPNVAYAKAMMHGLPRSAVLAQALPYFETTLLEDPLTILGIVLGCVAALVGCGKRAMAPVLGVCLSLLYVAWIGGASCEGASWSRPLSSLWRCRHRSPGGPCSGMHWRWGSCCSAC